MLIGDVPTEGADHEPFFCPVKLELVPGAFSAVTWAKSEFLKSSALFALLCYHLFAG